MAARSPHVCNVILAWFIQDLDNRTINKDLYLYGYKISRYIVEWMRENQKKNYKLIYWPWHFKFSPKKVVRDYL